MSTARLVGNGALTNIDYDTEIKKKFDELWQLRYDNENNEELYEIIRKLYYGFVKVDNYALNDRKQKILLRDMTAVHDALKAADAYIAIEDKASAEASTAEKSFRRRLAMLYDRAEYSPNSQWRDYLMYASLALTVLLSAAFIATLIVGAAPLVIVGLFVASLITAIACISATFGSHHQENHTFFGQSGQNHGNMKDLAEHHLLPLLPEKKGAEKKSVRCGCFG